MWHLYRGSPERRHYRVARGGAIPPLQARGFSALTPAIRWYGYRGIPSIHKYGNNATAACCLQNNICCV
ncbi:hypothetical protein JS565_09075 [Salmonella enterica subsp. enterica serovar Senftenberg]|nr:hypothetical protein [Salmonella enterica subsp. enterica serovar Senftenberg]